MIRCRLFGHITRKWTHTRRAEVHYYGNGWRDDTPDHVEDTYIATCERCGMLMSKVVGKA